MGATGSFPIDLVLFGMIAAFLILRLRSILGRRTGFERPAEPPAVARQGAPMGRVVDAVAEPQGTPIPAGYKLPDPASPPGQAFGRMMQLDPSFDPARFLGGAEAAFRLIIEAFARGDRDGLRPLLSEDTFRGFESVIAAREAAGETQRSELRAVNSATIEAADLRGSVADVTVRFVSDQVNITTARDGGVVTGADAVMEITDVWTFERDLTSSDPTWRLVAARSA